MEKATIIGIDLAKRVFQVQAASKDGRPVLRKKVSRTQLLGFLAKQPTAIVAMEACATAAIEAFAPPMATFKRGRDFAAWLGLVPRQHTTGGKPRLGRTSKMGQRDIRRLLIIGAMTVIRWAVRKGAAKP